MFITKYFVIYVALSICILIKQNRKQGTAVYEKKTKKQIILGYDEGDSHLIF